jgi:phosphoribosylaminoimidazolecarboxamide formyltransferase / IMP cyclohydrolase
MKKLALLSVSDKTGLVNIASRLLALGYELVSTGGTAKKLREEGLAVTDVSEMTGFPEILDDLVKTLHPLVHGGLLPPRIEKYEAVLAEHKIQRIHFLYVSIYELLRMLAEGGYDVSSIANNSDMGGPAMIASGGKGALKELVRMEEEEILDQEFEGPIVACSTNDANQAIDWIEAGQPEKKEFITQMAARAFWVCGSHRIGGAVALGNQCYYALLGENGRKLLKAENGQQGPAHAYVTDPHHPFNPAAFVEIQGHNYGYNSGTDRDRAITTLALAAAAFQLNFDRVPRLAVADKHGNPCSAAWGASSEDVLKQLVTCDREAILGATVAVNFPVGLAEAEIIRRYDLQEGEKPRLIDQLLAPQIDKEAVERFVRQDGKTVMMENPALAQLGDPLLTARLAAAQMTRPVMGGCMTQKNYLGWILDLRSSNSELYRSRKLAPHEVMDLLFCWAINRTSNSNTVTLFRYGKLIGNGVGQQARMRAARLAIQLANENGHGTKGAVVCSDSFFPKADGPRLLIEAGCRVLFATSTTNEARDSEIRRELEANGIAVLQMPDVSGRGFSWH